MAKTKILCVDDDQIIRHLVEGMLGLAGYDVITAEDTKTGLKRIKEDHPDLLIVDIMMPGKSGWEFIKELKEKEKIQIPIIVLSARGDPTSKDYSLKVLKADAYIPKPFTKDDLTKAVQKVLKK